MTEDMRKEISGGRLPEFIEEFPDEMALVIGGMDFVVAPPELGGRKLYIQGKDSLPFCPVCRHPGTTPMLVLDEGVGMTGCTECGQYGWVKLPRQEKEAE